MVVFSFEFSESSFGRSFELTLCGFSLFNFNQFMSSLLQQASDIPKIELFFG
jgi:hypothetical protein